jgi:hypothetical protein
MEPRVVRRYGTWAAIWATTPDDLSHEPIPDAITRGRLMATTGNAALLSLATACRPPGDARASFERGDVSVTVTAYRYTHRTATLPAHS